MSTSTTTIISLPHVTAYHLLGTETIPLTPTSPQTLSIVSSDPDAPSSSLTLTIGSSLAWPLVKGVTTMGSQKSNPRGYFLKPQQPKGEQVTGWIKIELSEGVVESGDRDGFERVLVKYGFLLGEVVESKADDVASAMREATTDISSSNSSGIAKSQEASEPDHPAEFSASTHSNLSSAADAVNSAKFYTHAAASTVLDLAYKLGSAAGDSLGIRGGEPTAESEKGDIRKGAESIASATATLGSGMFDGGSNLVSSGLSSAQAAIHTTYGKEAEDVANQSGTIVKDAGIAAADATMATSMVGHGYEAGMGAVGSETKSGEAA